MLFTNTSPSYVNLSVIGAEAPEESASAESIGRCRQHPCNGARRGDHRGCQKRPPSRVPAHTTADEATAELSGGSATATTADDDDGGSNTGLIIGIAVAAVVVLGIVLYVMRRRSSADDRE